MKIKDKLLKPFEIHGSANGYSVEEKTKNKNAKGDRLYRNHGYFSSVESCVLKVCKLKTESKDTITLKEYVKSIRSFKKAIIKKIKI